jgi:hypothetical protein
MTERRYNDDEIAEIFKRAAESRSATPHPVAKVEGLTLPELMEIGKEVGIAPETVTLAAGSLDRTDAAATRKLIGFPIGVGESLQLDRRLSDDEWDRLVVKARETFGARGTLRTDGSFRQWTNGNLQMLLEPTDRGHQIRLRTYNGSSRSMILIGLMSSGMATILGVSAIAASQAGLAGQLAGAGVLAAVGLGILMIGAGRLPGWARLRRKQMERLLSEVEATQLKS